MKKTVHTVSEYGIVAYGMSRKKRRGTAISGSDNVRISIGGGNVWVCGN